MADRFTQRIEDRRRRRNRLIVGSFLGLVLIGIGAWVVLASPWLTVRDIKVHGVEFLTGDEVVKAADVPGDVPLVRVDTEQIAKRVQELSPVATVDVERQLPRTLTIRVTERDAVAWTINRGARWAVDADGVVYRRLAKQPKHLPELRVDLDDSRALKAAAAVAGSLAEQKPKFAKNVRVVRAETKDSVQLDLKDGRLVIWGSADDAEQKVASLEALLPIRARRYDVSAPQRPTTTA